MPSPFPGMNPYFEKSGIWPDFHKQFILTLRGEINAAAPPRYFAGVEVDIILREPSARERWLKRSDVAVVEAAGESTAGGVAVSSRPLAAPAFAILPELDVEEERVWIEIRIGGRDGNRGRLVTHIELLSPSNKRQDRAIYLEKRNALRRSEANFVEIDLLRGGERMPLEGMPPCDGYAMVHRPEDGNRAGVWPIRLREPLPKLPIPLLPEDEPIVIDLQAVLNRAYDEAGYDRLPDLYEVPPDPPLSPEDAAWAESVVRAAASAR